MVKVSAFPTVTRMGGKYNFSQVGPNEKHLIMNTVSILTIIQLPLTLY